MRYSIIVAFALIILVAGCGGRVYKINATQEPNWDTIPTKAGETWNPAPGQE